METTPQDDKIVSTFDQQKAKPWTTEEYERIRQTAIAVAHSSYPLDLPTGATVPVVDGPLFWRLLTALDRDVI